MADDTQVVEVTGPDQKTYHFPTGTTKEQAVAYFKKKGVGIAPPASTKPPSVPKTPAEAASPEASKLWQMSDYKRRALAKRTQYDPSAAAYGFTPSHMAEEAGKGIISAGTAARDIGKDLLSNPNWFATMPQGARPSTMQKFATDPAKAEFNKAVEDYKHGRLLEAAGHGLAVAVPVVGPMASQLGEQAGRGDVGGALGQAAGLYLGGKGMKEIGDVAKRNLTNPQNFYNYAAKVDTELTQAAKQVDVDATKAQKLAPGLQMAKEGVIGQWKNLRQLIETRRMAKDVQVKSLAKAERAAGHTIDIENDVQEIENHTPPEMKGQLRRVLQQVRNQLVPGQGGAHWVPRDLRQLHIDEAMGIQKTLEEPLQRVLGSNYPQLIDRYAAALRKKIGERIGQVNPEIQRLRAEESNLIVDRKAVAELETKQLTGNYRNMRGLIYSGLGTLGMYVALRGLGAGWMGSFLGALTISTLYRSAPSATTRAALAAKWGQMLDSYYGNAMARGGFISPAAPSSPAGGPQGPQGPQVPRLQGVTGALPGQGASPQGAPPTAPASVVNPPGLPAPSNMPTAASRAASDLAFQQRYPKGVLPGKPMDPISEQAWAEGAFGAKPTEDVGKVSKQKSSAPRSGRGSVAESSTKTKAMMDRLDELQMRRDNPKSGADRVAIEREIDEIKRMLSGENLGTKHAGAPKRIADRERLAAKRAEAKAATPGAATAAHAGTTAEPASPSASPEVRAFALDAGYKKLATYEDGSSMVGALQKQAKDMQRARLPYDEVQALTDALNAMKEITGQ